MCDISKIIKNISSEEESSRGEEPGKKRRQSQRESWWEMEKDPSYLSGLSSDETI